VSIGLYPPSVLSRIVISLLILFVPVCLIIYWQLIPRLSPTARRLAGAMLAVQALVICLSLVVQPSTAFERRLWSINREFNLPSIVASMQLGSVAGVALLGAWLARQQPALPRVYLLGISLVFSWVALDEFMSFKSYTQESSWIQSTVALGVVTVAATLFVAARSPRSAWKWHACLLAGLALNALGAFFVDLLPSSGTRGYMEESLEILGAWLALIAVLGHFTVAVPLPATPVKLLLYLVPAISILLLLLYYLIPRLEMQLVAQPANVAYQSDIYLRGYRLDLADGKYDVRLYSSANVWNWNSINSDVVGYSIDLIDQASGDSVANHNEYVSTQLEFLLFGPDYLPIYRDLTELRIPPTTSANRAFWLVLTYWRKEDDEFIRQKALKSDLPLLSDNQVILSELVLPAASTAAPTSPLARFDNRFILEAADLPDRATAGAALPVSFAWRAEADSSEEYMQFLHLGHVEGGEWWVYDQQPLGARLPTRLWYSGLVDRETWKALLAEDLKPGTYMAYTGLYRLSDRERIPASDANGKPFLDARVPLGNLIIQR